ncbi:hypothetical protein G9U51_09025 [Calidifontibacter sp. DB0510]|uniref:Uridine kinase n=1 Tax=Metallococcus carri TaxID=1656884 RepID=A0A967B266_9MICO|nr:hypothetical protein [Metallococcus carri]NOP38397.1 hypothetical protein [Calidifontibacter sp. DB2511S]
MLIDGRSGSGKTTTATWLAQRLDAPVVHTDDVAWHLHPTEWVSALLGGVLDPWIRHEEVAYRPPGWVERGREGAITVPVSDRLVIEGVGAARSALAPLANVVLWVQSDEDIAKERGIARDIELGRTPAEAADFWEEWMGFEQPFLALERPWERAALVVNGTPDTRVPAHSWIARGPL